ncbi:MULTISPECIES: T9SS type A sorting domain-containing protein [Aequorivita]|uniref:T9SS type A sorting domain-containing protein n=1 Tax=Aequorivita iocasae TaxID=2803865 RepID=A0ABX7DNY0_9FLAO|nr:MULTISPECIES: T9SS type A sorting domain-containing protein [Aequorivita]QQX75256.1 T9SS type A sorting domain-containing protein [Aequorivita iocasae]UCA54704.1 T9SS type A sorting domain-containing protein [Aequorivita sp. F7]
MRKIISLLLLTLLSFKSNGQIQFQGAKEYGRLYNITFDPTTENTLYALSIGNHLMVSHDKGQEWQVLYSFPNSIVMLKDLKYRTDHSLTFIVDGTADEDGVYYYNLSTESIEQQFIAPIPSNSYRDWISSYSIYEGDSNIALVHQSFMDQSFNAFSKVYYTIDGGSTWQEIYYNVNYDGVHPNNVAIAPNNPNKLYVARGAGPNSTQGGLLISDDSGNNWREKMADITFNPITFHPVNADIMWMGTAIGDESQNEALYKSLDGGENWEEVNINWTAASLDCINFITYNPNNHDNIIVLEENEISISEDAGNTWTNYVYPENEPETYTFGFNASFNPFSSNEVFITADWYPMFSFDGGANLDIFPVPFHKNSMVGLAPGLESHLYYSLQDGIVHRDFTANQTESHYISPIDIFSLSNPTRYFVDPITFGRIYSFSDTFSGAFLEVSNNHGASRELLYQTFFDDVRALSPNPNSQDVVWVSMRDAGLFSFDFSNLNQIIETPIQTPGNGIVYEIYFSPFQNNEVWISINNSLYRSLDGGSVWEVRDNSLTLGTDEIVYDITQNPNNTDEYIAASSNGIYKTINGGDVWEKVYTASNIQKVAYSPISTGQLVASIYSSDVTVAQIIYSVDNGEEWQAVPLENIVHSLSFSMDYFFDQDAVDVYLATNDLGVIKLNVALDQLDSPEYTTSNEIIIYPNPTNDEINVQAGDHTIKELVLYNNLGGEVNRYSVIKRISLSNLQKGIYYLKITTEKGIYIKRVIKD